MIFDEVAVQRLVEWLAQDYEGRGCLISLSAQNYYDPESDVVIGVSPEFTIELSEVQYGIGTGTTHGVLTIHSEGYVFAEVVDQALKTVYGRDE